MKNKILMIDDDVDLVETNVAVLKNAGYDVQSAFDSVSGLEVFKSFKPDVAIVDLSMEHFDSGFVLCHKIKNSPEGKNTPVIILTAAGHETGYRFSTDTKEETRWIRADYFLDKPISPIDLVQFLHDKVLKK